MYSTLATLIDRLDSSAVSKMDVIRWGCPVAAFGDLLSSRVATVGLNPSNREFVDEAGEELQGASRRFHTLRSLGLRSWSEVDARHLRMILDSYSSYFLANPYDRWFKRLDHVISGTGASFYDTSLQASFYGTSLQACHLDLIPYATLRKWTDLTAQQRSSLLTVAGDTLGLLLRDSQIRLLILNGNSVVQQFQDIAGVRLERYEMPAWSLPRQSQPGVMGVAYQGEVDVVSGIALGHQVQVLGFNHNLQSSFGVTNEVINGIRRWIGEVSEEPLSEAS